MNNQLKNLEKSFKDRKLSHAYLFFGDSKEIIFKTALNFARIVLKEKSLDRLANNLNLSIIDAREEKEIKVESIRGLKSFMSLSSGGDGHRVAIIKNADKLNASASNAILKLLEEPSGNKVIILTTSNVGSLLPTIVSRTERLRVFTKEEKYVSIKNKDLDILCKIFKSNTAEKLNIVEKISKRDNPANILVPWIPFFQDILYAKYSCDDLILNKFYSKQILNIAKNLSEEDLKNILKSAILMEKTLKDTNVNFRLILENLVINI